MQPDRHHDLDNLRIFVIFLVVLLHAALSYMAYAPEWWYVLDPERSLFFTALVLVVDVPIMLIMFFLAGYFTPASLAKRAPLAFLKDKAVRIGIPWLFGALVLAPPTTYMIYFSRKVPLTFWTFWRTEFWGRAFQQSVYWYLGVLLLFFSLTALVHHLTRDSSLWTPVAQRKQGVLLLGFFAVMTVPSLLLGLVYPLDLWTHIYVFVFQPTRVPLYIGYFALGLFAHRRGWFREGGYAPQVLPWLPLCLFTGLAYLGWRLAPVAPTAFTKSVAALLFNAFCFTSLLTSLAVFRRWGGSAHPFWRSQARNSYGVYYLHPLILYPLILAFVPLPLSIFVKAPLVTLLAYLASWGLSAGLLTRVPGLRRMF